MRPSDQRRNRERVITIATLAGWRYEPSADYRGREWWWLKSPDGDIQGIYPTIAAAAAEALVIMDEQGAPDAAFRRHVTAAVTKRISRARRMLAPELWSSS